MNTKYATSTETRGNPGCASAPDGWINADVTTLVQTWASAKAALSSMGLRASSESVIGQWKRVNSANATANPPKLTVNYNYRPQTGTKQEAGPPFVQDKTPAWRVDTTTPTLRDTFADKDGDQVNGTFQIFDAATNTQVGNTMVSPFVPAGTPASVVVPAGVLQHGHMYRFRTSPYDGTHYSASWSPWSNWSTFTVSPLPDAPQDLQAGAQQTLTPILSAIVTTPAQTRVSAEFSFKDSAGNPVPGLPLPPVWVESGSRAALEIPEGKLTDGASYRWSVRTCDGVGCSPWSAEQNLTVRLQPLPTMPATQSLVVTGSALAGVSAATDCDAAGCATVPGGRLRVGPADGHVWATHLKADLGALPKGARLTSAKLALTRADCTTQCEVQKPGVYELSAPWSPAQSGKDLLTAAGSESYASGTPLAEVDFGMLVQSWTDRANEGMALTVPAGAAGAAYYSDAAADPALRPRLTIEYLPPTAPGALTDVVPTAGDTGLLATWNAPLDGGATGDISYVAKAEKSDGTVVGTWEGAERRAVFSGLDNSLSYRVAVTAKNGVGSGPVSRSALVRGTAVSGGSASYKDYVQAYLSARNKVTTGVSLTTADAAAESPYGGIFREVLGVQEAAIVGGREALATQGHSYVGISSALTDTVIVNSAADQVVVRTSVIQTATLRVDGVDQVSEDRGFKRFVFSLAGGSVKLTSEADDSEAGQTLSSTAAAGSQVVATPADSAGVPTGFTDSIELGADGFPTRQTSAAGAVTASYVNGSGTGNWAFNNTGVPREYGSNDCTNFVSKALYYGGGMKMRSGFWWSNSAWWKNPPTSWKKNSNTWSGAQNLFTHLFDYRQPGYVNRSYNLQPGDILFFRWKKDNAYNHAAVVTGISRGVVLIAQHGYEAHSTLPAIMARNNSGNNPIVEIGALRPRSR